MKRQAFIANIPRSPAEIKTVVKTFGVDFNSSGGALTLESSHVRGDDLDYDGPGLFSRTHASGWTIEGTVKEDYYEWVNGFMAVHPKLGKVWGNFEEQVFADSEEAYQDFYEKHPPHAWDYDDI